MSLDNNWPLEPVPIRMSTLKNGYGVKFAGGAAEKLQAETKIKRWGRKALLKEPDLDSNLIVFST